MYLLVRVQLYNALGAEDGVLSMVELGPAGKEKLTKLLGYMKGATKVSCIQWRPSKFELIAGNETGQITIWKTVTGAILRKNYQLFQ